MDHLVSVCVTFGLLKFLFGFPLCSGRTCRGLGSFGNPCLSETQDCNNEKLVCLYDEFNENWVFLGSASVKVIWTSLSPNCDPSGLAFVSSWNGCNAPLGWQTERRTQKADNSRGKVNDAVREWVMIVLPLIKSRQAHSHKAHFLLSVYLKTHRPVWKWRCWILAAQLMLIGLFKGIVHLKTKTYVFLRCSFFFAKGEVLLTIHCDHRCQAPR